MPDRILWCVVAIQVGSGTVIESLHGDLIPGWTGIPGQTLVNSIRRDQDVANHRIEKTISGSYFS